MKLHAEYVRVVAEEVTEARTVEEMDDALHQLRCLRDMWKLLDGPTFQAAEAEPPAH
jgi:hypothetical protein